MKHSKYFLYILIVLMTGCAAYKELEPVPQILFLEAEYIELNDEDEKFYEFSRNFQELTRVMQNHPGIIIAGLHGWIIGGGFEITLSAFITRYSMTLYS